MASGVQMTPFCKTDHCVECIPKWSRLHQIALACSKLLWPTLNLILNKRTIHFGRWNGTHLDTTKSSEMIETCLGNVFGLTQTKHQNGG